MSHFLLAVNTKLNRRISIFVKFVAYRKLNPQYEKKRLDTEYFQC